jgi:hypothetical protein
VSKEVISGHPSPRDARCPPLRDRPASRRHSVRLGRPSEPSG